VDVYNFRKVNTKRYGFLRGRSTTTTTRIKCLYLYRVLFTFYRFDSRPVVVATRNHNINRVKHKRLIERKKPFKFDSYYSRTSIPVTSFRVTVLLTVYEPCICILCFLHTNVGSERICRGLP